MKELYLKLIELYTTTDITLEGMAENLKGIEMTPEDKEKAKIIFDKRCEKLPEKEKDEEREYVIENVEAVLETMLIFSLPESLGFLGKYTEKVERELLVKGQVIIEKQNIYLYLKKKRLETLNKVAKPHYLRKRREILKLAFDIMPEEVLEDPILLVNKYDLNREIVLDEIKKRFKSMEESKIKIEEVTDEKVKKEIEKNIENLIEAKFGLSILKDFVKSGMYIDDYCLLRDMNAKQLERRLEELRKIDAEIFESMANLIVTHIEKEKEYVLAKAKEIEPYLKNGIPCGDGVINFTTLDFYCVTKDRPCKCHNKYYHFSSILGSNGKTTTLEKLNKIFKSHQRNELPDETNIEFVRSINMHINGEKVSDEIINQVFEVLTENDLRKTIDVVTVGMERAVNGYPILPLIEHKNKVTNVKDADLGNNIVKLTKRKKSPSVNQRKSNQEGVC